MRQPTSHLALTLLLAASVGCGGTAGVSESTVAASVGSATLTVGQLTTLLTHAPVTPTAPLAFGLTSVWIDHALVLSHLDQLHSEPVATAATAQSRQDSIVARLIAARRVTARQPTAAEIDSVGRRNDVRVFRLYSIAIPPGDSAAQVEAAKTLSQLRDAALAARTSPTEQIDQLADADRTHLTISDLPAAGHGELPPALAARIWDLSGGEISLPLLTQGMVQIFYRVPRPAADPALATWLRGALQQRADEAMIDSLLTARHFAIPADVAARLRLAFVDPGMITGDAPIATWDGGATTPAEALEWIRTIPPAARAAQVGSSDSALVDVARAAGRRELIRELWAGMDTSGVAAAARATYDSQVALLIADADQVATGTGIGERAYAWSTAEALAQVPYRSEPSGLGAALRARDSVSVNAVAVRAAVTEAARLWQAPGR